MVFKGLRAKLLKAKAKAHGMTVPELERYLAERKSEKRKFKEELRQKEREEKQKHKKWEIEQKYKRKRKQVKAGKSSGALGLIELLGSSTFTSKKTSTDPLGLFGSPVKKKKKRKRRKK